ncbi:MAG: hypothetical protein ACLR8Y_00005 [Alistipes indistinctus]
MIGMDSAQLRRRRRTDRSDYARMELQPRLRLPRRSSASGNHRVSSVGSKRAGHLNRFPASCRAAR